mmetsp:Transcript_13867/g.33033  ORF Transcript_13867/g.33033 Transcript_13867/m.33033 type:complete len:120 (-) Transcript_13867:283-642(-)
MFRINVFLREIGNDRVKRRELQFVSTCEFSAAKGDTIQFQQCLRAISSCGQSSHDATTSFRSDAKSLLQMRRNHLRGQARIHHEIEWALAVDLQLNDDVFSSKSLRRQLEPYHREISDW